MYGAQPNNPNQDFEVAGAPMDGISSLSWSPRANYLVSGSWNNAVNCWEVQATGQTIPKAVINHQAPVLDVTWKGDGMTVFSGSCDKTAIAWNLQTGQSQPVAQHDAPIKKVHWVEEANVLMTGSWDRTLRYWDLRTPTAQATVNLPERLYASDVTYPLAVCATAERIIVIYDLRKPTVEYKRIQSPLKFQSRCLAAFPDKTGFALGSIEGRVAIHHVEDHQSNLNFAFKCHRVKQDIYAVNSIDFHPIFHTFATAGSDGSYNFWDKNSKQRLKPFKPMEAPISAAAFSADGLIYAYSVSYDWHKGASGYNPNAQSRIFLHNTTEAEIKPRARKK